MQLTAATTAPRELRDGSDVFGFYGDTFDWDGAAR
jgi:hypothetical protein